MTEQADHTLRRRALLETDKPARSDHYFVVTLCREAAGINARLRYVPDRDILRPEAFDTYLNDAFSGADGTLESLARTVLDDVNDQVIPCWIEVLLTRNAPVEHSVRIEDRQPRWQDKGLLDRIGP